MNKKIEKRLAKKFAQLLPKLSERATCLNYGFECEDGWANLLETLFEKLELIRTETGATAVFCQIKEKFGTLHAYYDLHYKGKVVKNLYISFLDQGATMQTTRTKPSKKLRLLNSIITTLVGEAKLQSAHTCEVSGDPGTICYPKPKSKIKAYGRVQTLSKEEADKKGYIPLDPQIAKAWKPNPIPKQAPKTREKTTG